MSDDLQVPACAGLALVARDLDSLTRRVGLLEHHVAEIKRSSRFETIAIAGLVVIATLLAETCVSSVVAWTQVN